MLQAPFLKRLVADRIRDKRPQLREWYLDHAKRTPPPFYCSIDIRDSGFKIVPVDSNLYPAGFNNVCPEDRRTAPQILKQQIDRELDRICRRECVVERVLILPESHTQNTFYLENLYYLREIVADAGFKVEIGWYPTLETPGSEAPAELKTAQGKSVHPKALTIQDGVLRAGDFRPDLILLNNDFSAGYPVPLDSVKQPIVPSHRLGWHTRKKTEHFKRYNTLAGEFAAMIEIDPWFLQVDTEEVSPVNFNEEIGIEPAAQAVDRMLERLRAQYKAHKVERTPFVYAKANSGTYGMGIQVVHSGDELRQMNRRTKNKMSVGKGRIAIQSLAIQEGVPTATLVDRLTAEPVIYLFGHELIGGFLRTNSERSDEENLNSQGMVFRKLCMSDLRQEEDGDEVDGETILELVYGAVARISALATGQELQSLT